MGSENDPASEPTAFEPLVRLEPSGWPICRCDFCTGKKRWEDNWCARCGDVQMTPPKWWENCDVCDACEAAIRLELEQEAAERGKGERMMMKYRCKHVVEAMRWSDTVENRASFAAWFESHGVAFETRGSAVVFADECGEATEGEWITFSDGEFLAMDEEFFAETYEPATEGATK